MGAGGPAQPYSGCMAWVPTVDARSAPAGERRRRPAQIGVALLMVVTFLPALVRWLWLGAALLALVALGALASWRGGRARLARWRERMALRTDPRAHRVTGTVRHVTDRSVEHRGRAARVTPFAIETDDRRLVLVDPTHGYVSSRLRSLSIGDRVTVLGPVAETALDFVMPELRLYRGGEAPLALGGRLDAPVFVEKG